MKILVIGGTGHIGRFLIPMLVDRGGQVVVVSRGSTPAGTTAAWQKVELQTARYAPQDAAWCDCVAQAEAEVVIDIIGVDVPGTYEAARSTCKHFIACGSIWMFGPPRTIPTPDTTQSPCESEGYAQRYRQIQATRDKAARDGIAFTAIMPPNICGPGKIPLDGHGGRGADVHKAHIQGTPVKLPLGCNTSIGPCDAEDIARAFCLAVYNRQPAAGEIFNVGAAYGLPAPQFIEAYARIYNTEIPIEYVSHENFYSTVLPDPGANYHFREHMLPDISKIRAKLGYEPEYTPEQTMERAVAWMREEGII